MNLFRILRRVNFKSFWGLLKLCVRNPFFVLPTISATKECLSISTIHFGRLHYQNTPANAFRHALWNFIIAKKCTYWSKNYKKVLRWTKNITDWHENAFKNRVLARKMDLHNNEVGRRVFINNQTQSFEKVIQILNQMTQNSLKINEQTALENHELRLVHITD